MDVTGIRNDAARAAAMGVRRFGRVNWLGLYTLSAREIQRFMAVWTQTLAAPLATAALFLGVFSLAIGPARGEVMGVPFIQFLAPGILMMTVIQNAFANTSSSILIAKVQGNIVDTLMPPLSPGELLVGYALGGATRGLAVAAAVGLPMFPVLGIAPASAAWMLAFAGLGALAMALAGMIAGMHCSKFDQMAALTNFVVTPLAFLSGTFYSVADLPTAFWAISHANPVFYLIDGFRHGALGVSDSSPWLGLAVTLAATAGLGRAAYGMLKRGYGLKS